MRITNTHVYFYTNCFSNWFPTKHIQSQFKEYVNHLVWNNTEEAFMYYKAIHFKDYLTATKIIEHSNLFKHPSGVKDLGRQVRDYDDTEWSKVRYKYMVYVNYLKYSQNSGFKDKLMETGDKILVEASPVDKVWGVGLAEDDDLILDEKNWLGQNLLGKALMEVRSLLK